MELSPVSSNINFTSVKTNDTSVRKRTYSSSSTFNKITRNAILTTTSSSTSNSIDVSSTSSTSRTIYSTSNDEIASVLSPGKKQRLQQHGTDQEIYTTTTHHHIVTDQSHTTTTTANILNIPSAIPSQRNVPAFLHKLYNMVGDESTMRLVRWSIAGNSFLVEGHEEFAKSVLPRFYKHNTFASFVRQLNMYDFHKVPHIQQGVIVNEAAESEVWEFSHPNFRKNRPDLLALVTRKRNRDRDDPSSDVDGVNLRSLVKEISAIRQHQSNITADLKNLHRDNEIIWKETLAARESHHKHQQVITKILQFLTVVFSNESHQLEGVLSDIMSKEGKKEYEEILQRNKTLSQQTQPSTNNSDNTIVTSQHHVTDDGNCNNDDFAKISLKEKMKSMTDTRKAKSESKKDMKKAMKPSSANNTNATGTVSKENSLAVARRSAKAITNDINELQGDVETLAAQLGIDSTNMSTDYVNYGSFSNEYSVMTSSATENDKLRLYELADRKTSPSNSPRKVNDVNPYPTQDVLLSESVHTSSARLGDNSASYAFGQFAKMENPYRGTSNVNNVGAHVNKNCTNTIFQSNLIPSVTTASNNGLSQSFYNVSNNTIADSSVSPNAISSLGYDANNFGKRNEPVNKPVDKQKGVYIDSHVNNRLFLSSVMNQHQMNDQKFLNLQVEQRAAVASSPISLHTSTSNGANNVPFTRNQYPSHAPDFTLHSMPPSNLSSEMNYNNNGFNDTGHHHHHSFHNVHQLEQYINVMNSSNNNDSAYTQHIAEASNYMNQNENKSKKEDGTIVY
ncbi:unnamed protein product [Mucor hiemalis]